MNAHLIDEGKYEGIPDAIPRVKFKLRDTRAIGQHHW